jgi:hypothetical protein
MLFETTIAGSLPKPAWLAEPNKLWAPWKLSGDALLDGERGKPDRHTAENSSVQVGHCCTNRLIGYPTHHVILPEVIMEEQWVKH